MWKVLMPRKIVFGENAAKEFQYPKNSLVVTTTTPDIYNKWLDYMGIKNYEVYDKVTPDPSIETIEALKKQYEGKQIGAYIGLGGGSSRDVCKYLSKLTGIPKILIPTTFGTGAEMTTYAVISFEHKKKLLQDEAFLADAAIVDPYFLPGTPFNIMRNSACDAAAQASEGYDSKAGNPFTQFFCKEAFDILYDAIMNDKPNLLPYGAMLSGIGFGNSSTTLGHALSYVFSNEGVPHGYALSSCTTVAHKFNKSVYYKRFKEIAQKLKFEPLKLKQPLDAAADVIMPDRGHLDNNPIPVTKQDIIGCLDEIVNKNPLA
ncbi:iron-containing alcohol dehydrogenase [Nitrososphaera sp.]|uniref:iron-containing alcohol dehydrogenase n=1 Tax=Nitrososphaera sp. TaxID=1971748 RepID=UPI0017C8AD78|nr:iron-containing alcohol dehydrogenase [Nitrososphaera sp.]NWG37878.1 iron-containing alcohol dehydrogenase [Nitrososphaera sp.]